MGFFDLELIFLYLCGFFLNPKLFIGIVLYL